MTPDLTSESVAAWNFISYHSFINKNVWRGKNLIIRGYYVINDIDNTEGQRSMRHLGRISNWEWAILKD